MTSWIYGNQSSASLLSERQKAFPLLFGVSVVLQISKHAQSLSASPCRQLSNMNHCIFSWFLTKDCSIVQIKPAKPGFLTEVSKVIQAQMLSLLSNNNVRGPS